MPNKIESSIQGVPKNSLTNLLIIKKEKPNLLLANVLATPTLLQIIKITLCYLYFLIQ